MSHLYIGTYSQRDSKGIYLCSFDPTSGALEIVGTAPSTNPSFLARHPAGDFLYAVNEELDGAIASYAIDRATGALTLINHQPSGGAHPCFLSLAGDWLLVANYSGGTVAALPIRPDGALGPATSLVQHKGSGPTERQQGPHPHAARQIGEHIYIPDLGLDQILIDRLIEGELRPNDIPYAAMAPGSGPRHLTASPDGRFIWVVHELNSTLTLCGRDAATGALEPIQTVSTIPAGYTGVNYPADIHLHPSGRFLYTSNREHDSIALFQVGPDGRLKPDGHFPSGGRWPRSFGIDPSGRYLVAAHQHGDSLVSFAIDQETGHLTPTGHSLQIPAAVCVRF